MHKPALQPPLEKKRLQRVQKYMKIQGCRVKKEVVESCSGPDVRYFTSKQQLWEVILTSCKDIQAQSLQKVTRSVDGRKSCKAAIK